MLLLTAPAKAAGDKTIHLKDDQKGIYTDKWSNIFASENSENNNAGNSITNTNECCNFHIISFFQGNPYDIIAPKGVIDLAKVVEGIEIFGWLYETEYLTVDALIERYNLYKVDGCGAPLDGLTPIDSITLYFNSSIYFEELEDGWYAIEEILTEAGKNIFAQPPVMYILITNGLMTSGAADSGIAGYQPQPVPDSGTPRVFESNLTGWHLLGYPRN